MLFLGVYMEKNRIWQNLPPPPIANLKELSENVGKPVVVEVRLLLGDKEPEYIIKRSIAVTKKADSEEVTLDSPRFIVAIKKGKSFETYRDKDVCEQLVEQVLPSDLLEIFVFDSSMMRSFFEKKRMSRVKEEIAKVSYIQAIEKALNALNERKRAYEGSMKKIAQKKGYQEIEEIKEELDRNRENLGKFEKELSSVNKNILDGEEKLREISEKIKRIEPAKELQEKREQLEKESEKISNEIEGIENENKLFLFDIAPLIFGYSAAKKTSNIIEQFRKKKYLPPGIREAFIKDILEDETCICGTHPLEPKHKKYLEDWLVKAREWEKAEEASKEATATYIPPDTMKEKIVKALNKYDENERKIKEKQIRLDTIPQQLEKISSELKKLGGIEIKYISGYEKLREEIYEAIKEERTKKEDLELRKKLLEREIKDLEEKLEKISSISEEIKGLQSSLALIRSACAILNELKDGVVGEIRRIVERNMREKFRELHWKREKDIEIADDFSIKVIGATGEKDGVSGGETEMVALTFLSSLTAISGFDAPIMIENPFGVLGIEEIEKLVMGVSKFFKEKQVFLLMNPKDFEKVEELISPHLLESIDLIYDESEKRTIFQSLRRWEYG